MGTGQLDSSDDIEISFDILLGQTRGIVYRAIDLELVQNQIIISQAKILFMLAKEREKISLQMC